MLKNIFKGVVVGLMAGLVLSACSKKKLDVAPPVAPTSPTYSRGLINTIEYGTTSVAVRTNYPSFVEGCVQVVEYTNLDTKKAEFQQLEFSSEVCPTKNGAVSLMDAASVRAEFHMKKDGEKTIFFFKNEDNAFGEFASQSYNGETWIELTELCTGDYDGNCTVTVENTKLKSIQ